MLKDSKATEYIRHHLMLVGPVSTDTPVMIPKGDLATLLRERDALRAACISASACLRSHTPKMTPDLSEVRLRVSELSDAIALAEGRIAERPEAMRNLQGPFRRGDASPLEGVAKKIVGMD